MGAEGKYAARNARIAAKQALVWLDPEQRAARIKKMAESRARTKVAVRTPIATDAQIKETVRRVFKEVRGATMNIKTTNDADAIADYFAGLRRREEAREGKDQKHRAKFPAKYPPKRAAPAIELMPDETMVTAEGREGRIMTLSPLHRLYRKGSISAEAFRVGQCLTADLEMLMGSNGWAAVAEGVERVTGSKRSYDVSASRLEAAYRVMRARQAIGFQEQFLTLVGLLEGFGTEELDRLWQRRRNARQSQIVCINALTFIVEAHVYETLKHQPSVWAEAAA